MHKVTFCRLKGYLLRHSRCRPVPQAAGRPGLGGVHRNGGGRQAAVTLFVILSSTIYPELTHFS